MKKLIIIIITIFCVNDSFAKSIVADLSNDSININTGFNGAELFLFGTYDGQEGDDLFIFIEGPKTEATIYKKDYVSGIWINKQSVTFKNVPSFYYSIYSKSKVSGESLNYLTLNKLGSSNLRLISKNTQKLQNLDEWINNFDARMKKNEMWVTKKGTGKEKIEIKDNKLFRAPVILPATVLPGNYKVKILHLRDGKRVSEENTQIFVKKTGMGSKIYNFAHDYSSFYGIFAITLAVFAGYLAAVGFRKV
tara:strand:- start:1287 stop:2036 length:750 start_codon:yes stop_codon:yes gene_type:complete